MPQSDNKHPHPPEISKKSKQERSKVPSGAALERSQEHHKASLGTKAVETGSRITRHKAKEGQGALEAAQPDPEKILRQRKADKSKVLTRTKDQGDMERRNSRGQVS